MKSSMHHSKWERTNNPSIWKDQLGNMRDMTSDDPSKYKNEDGDIIANITQLSSFLPKNIAGSRYNNPHRHIGSNPEYLYFENENMLIYLNDKVGKLCDKHVLQRQGTGSKNYRGAKLLFENNGDNKLFLELQKLFCAKTCLFDPIGYHKVCENHFSLEDIANIDALENIPGFLAELSLYDEFFQKPFPQINLDLLRDNADGKIQGRANSINIVNKQLISTLHRHKVI